MRRAAIELSASFIIILIISLVVFVGGISIAYKMFGQATVYSAHIDKGVEEEIERILGPGGKIALPRNQQALKFGQSYVFGLGIFNGLGGRKRFNVSIMFNKAVDRNNVEIAEANAGFVNSNWVFSEWKTFEVNNNDFAKVPLYVVVKERLNNNPRVATKPGTYSFNVCVCVDQCLTQSDPPIVAAACDKNIVNFYDDHLHKVYVEVP